MRNGKCFFLLITWILIGSCDGNYQYEKLMYNMKDMSMSLGENSDFVIDSVVMKHKNEVLYKSFLVNKTYGIKDFDLNSINPNYETPINKLNKICSPEFNDNWQAVTIWIRNKNYYGGNRYKERDSVQIFGVNKFPCDTVSFVLDARRRKYVKHQYIKIIEH